MDLALLLADFLLPEEGFLLISSAYAGDHGLGRGGMRDSGGNDWGDESAMLRRISHGGG